MSLNIFHIETYGVSGWEPGDTFIEPTRWALPEEAARERLDEYVRQQLALGEPVEKFDGVIRVRLWTREQPLAADEALRERWPDAMATWHKPNTAILEAAINAAAPFYAPYINKHNDLQAASHYHAACRVVQAVLDMHNLILSAAAGADAGELISLAAALLPEHR